MWANLILDKRQARARTWTRRTLPVNPTHRYPCLPLPLSASHPAVTQTELTANIDTVLAHLERICLASVVTRSQRSPPWSAWLHCRLRWRCRYPTRAPASATPVHGTGTRDREHHTARAAPEQYSLSCGQHSRRHTEHEALSSQGPFTPTSLLHKQCAYRQHPRATPIQRTLSLRPPLVLTLRLQGTQAGSLKPRCLLVLFTPCTWQRCPCCPLPARRGPCRRRR